MPPTRAETHANQRARFPTAPEAEAPHARPIALRTDHMELCLIEDLRDPGAPLLWLRLTETEGERSMQVAFEAEDLPVVMAMIEAKRSRMLRTQDRERRW